MNDPYINRKVSNPLTKLKGRTVGFKNGEYKIIWQNKNEDELTMSQMQMVGISFD